MNDGQIAAAVAKVLEAYGVPADPSAAAPAPAAPVAPAAPTAGSVSEMIARGIAKASSDDQIAQIVAKVVGDYSAQAAKPAVVPGAAASTEAGDGVFDTMDAAVDAAVLAQQQYLLCSMTDRQRFVDGIREVILQKTPWS